MSKHEGSAPTAPADDPYRRLPFSGLSGRILLFNVIGLALLVGGILYVNQFRSGLIETRLSALEAEAILLAGALGETATGGPETTSVDIEMAAPLLRRLTVGQESRVRMFRPDGSLALDSRELLPAASVVTEALPAPGEEENGMGLRNIWDAVRTWLIRTISSEPEYPPYLESYNQTAADYPETLLALDGDPGRAVREQADGSLVLTVAVPVQRLRRVLGAILVSIETTEIEEVARQERTAILEIFLVALAVTALLSVFLASNIARPVSRLAAFAHTVRQGRGRETQPPDFSNRRDEVGDLSRALGDMTQALYRRIDSIEAFAADVSHEFKNPITSLRSAVETMERTDNPEHKQRLMEIVKEDLGRLDRLISDISNASRLDAELLRAEMRPIDVPRMMQAIVSIYRGPEPDSGPELRLDVEGDGLIVPGIESHLGQVFRNLIDNAISFSPKDGVIEIGVRGTRDHVVVEIRDQGPGIDEDKLTKIFDRFYSERPKDEPFGTHSGLGLNICGQIIAAHNGEIHAENRYGPAGLNGPRQGAIFVVELPTATRPRSSGGNR
ncbi:MAG: stimulus-sensing domain-containing protein [Alphaproteobacteria bacterium]